ncbi:hypothetical protein AgCh_018587 [Apium graveolens]
MKKMKFSQDDTASENIIMSSNPSTGSHLPLKIMFSVKEESEKQGERTREIDFKVMCSVIEEKRREIERLREVDKVRSWEEMMIKKAKYEERMVFLASVLLGQQPTPEFLHDRRGLHSSVEEVKSLLQGKSHSELKLVQSEIMFQVCFECASDVQYWEPVLKLIHKYKVKACLKDIRAKLFWEELKEDCRSLSCADEAEETGSSCSRELLQGEEIGDNFEMKQSVIVPGNGSNVFQATVHIRSQVYLLIDSSAAYNFLAFEQIELYFKGTVDFLDILLVRVKAFTMKQLWTKMLVGNKKDLANTRNVSVEEGAKLAEEEGLFFTETSALDSTNVNKAFEFVIGEIYNNVRRKALNSDSYKTDLSANGRAVRDGDEFLPIDPSSDDEQMQPECEQSVKVWE